LVWFLPLPAWAADAAPGEVVKTTHGPVRGLVEDGIHAFLGLRYGAPPVGELRFRPAGAPEPWTAIADASAYGAPAIQMATGASANPTTELSKQLATIFTTSKEMTVDSEDCLFRNVWTPGLTTWRARAIWWW
jgi:para-nitrobenzyl esterase